MFKASLKTAAFIPLALGLAACDNNATQFAPGEFYGVTTVVNNVQNLVSFDRQTPSTLRINSAITGLATGDVIVGFDRRPSDGTLFALTRNGTVGKLYTINPQSAVATTFCTLDTALDAAANFGVDFNPSVAAVAPATINGALRIVSSNDGVNNFRIPPAQLQAPATTCAVTTDGAFANGVNVSGVAYTNSVSGTVANTSIFYISSVTNTLTTSLTPNAPTTPTNVGALGIVLNGINGFDISGNGDVATIASAIGAATVTSIINVNLGNGATTVIGTLPGTTILVGFTATN